MNLDEYMKKCSIGFCSEGCLEPANGDGIRIASRNQDAGPLGRELSPKGGHFDCNGNGGSFTAVRPADSRANVDGLCLFVLVPKELASHAARFSHEGNQQGTLFV